MKNIFFIVDCSGSIVVDDTVKIGQINDLVRDSIDKCNSKGKNNISVVCYSDTAKIHWKSSSNNFFYDISDDKFGGRSNLGQAYKYVKNLIDNAKISISDCVIVLISDGEATDNYRRELQTLDSKNQSVRLSFSIGTSYSTTLQHASKPTLMFKNGIRDREDFLDRLGDVI